MAAHLAYQRGRSGQAHTARMTWLQWAFIACLACYVVLALALVVRGMPSDDWLQPDKPGRWRSMALHVGLTFAVGAALVVMLGAMGGWPDGTAANAGPARAHGEPGPGADTDNGERAHSRRVG